MLDLRSGWTIVVDRVVDDEVGRAAAAELDRVLTRIIVPRSPAAGGVGDGVGVGATIVLGDQGDDRATDGFAWEVTRAGATVRAGNGRGLHYGVAALLEHVGCAWPAPGLEHLPPPLEGLALGSGASAPRLAGRALTIGSEAFLPRLEEWLAWGVRNGLNTVFFHTDPPDGGIGGALPDEVWQDVRPRALELVRRYGLVLELGGHGLSHLLPRAHFADSPDAFRTVDGARVADRNLCASSRAGLDILRSNARVWFLDNPEVDVFHVWPDDLPGGGWCACDRCEQLSPSDQAMAVTTVLAGVLADVSPLAQLSFLAYHDTESAPQLPPPPNVCALWAPRRRCYGHPLDDPSCAVNDPGYRSTTNDLFSAFTAAGAAPSRVFEYWLDGILFKGALPVFAGAGADLQLYADAGAHTVQALLVGPRDLVGAWPTPALFARLAWDPDRDPHEVLSWFARTALGDDSAALALRQLDEAWRLALTLDPAAIPSPERMLAMFERPKAGVSDVEDPYGAPEPVLQAGAERLRAAMALASPAAARLAAGPAGAEADAALRCIRFLHARVHAYLEGDPSAIASYRAAYDDVLAWGDDHLEAEAARRTRRLLHLFWGLRLRALEGSALSADQVVSSPPSTGSVTPVT